MVPKLIYLAVETILKLICEKIKIRNILIVNKNNKFNGIIDELNIKAENVIYNKINISNVNISIKDLIIRYPFRNKKKIFYR